jgi:hypothetical protein
MPPLGRLRPMRIGLFVVICLLAGCADGVRLFGEGAPTAGPTEGVAPEQVMTQVTCGGSGPAFPASILDEPGGAQHDDDPAAAALRRHLDDPAMGMEVSWLPKDGWRAAIRDDAFVLFVAEVPGEEGSLAEVTTELQGESWQVTGWGSCQPMADVGPDHGLAQFRVAPDEELTPEMTEIDVLVTERACNSGQDARGRIEEPTIVAGDETMTVVFAVRPRGGAHTCPSNPETPFLLELPEPLGERTLLDGSSVPPRDATICPDAGMCR